MKRWMWLGLAILAAVGVGLVLGGRARGQTAYELERAAVSVQLARTMLPYKVAFRVALGAVLLLTLAGLGWGTVRWLHRRAEMVYPNGAGLYPIREGRIGGVKVFHDPNRALGGSTLYATGGRNIRVQHPLPPGQEVAQQQITAQAQVAQAVRAAVSGSSPLPPAQNLPADLLVAGRLSRPMPEVRELAWEPSHIERLLLQEGGEAD
jgi:hypothetical protein